MKDLIATNKLRNGKFAMIIMTYQLYYNILYLKLIHTLTKIKYLIFIIV